MQRFILVVPRALLAIDLGRNIQGVCDDVASFIVFLMQAYLHSRMRARTTALLKVLNRARPESKVTEKKTIS